MAAETRLTILKTFQSNGLLLDKEALAVLAEYLLPLGSTEDAIMLLIEACQAGISESVFALFYMLSTAKQV